MIALTAFLRTLVLVSSLSATFSAVIPDGFISEVVTSTKGMSGTFLPNPRNDNKPMMILNAKNGQINVLENPDESPDAIEIIDLSEGPKVCNNGERGLHTVIPSPSFTENRHLFAFFTKHREGCLEDPVEGPYNVVMRFTMDGETLMLDYDEGTLIFRGPPMDERLHNGGAMAFGNDGKLYITMGDAGKRANADPLDNVHGSIIRLNEDGSVPDDNPYTVASGYDNSYRCADTAGRVPADAPENSVCAEVWANGLRNPFRIDMDQAITDKVKFSFGVVGAQHIEALYFGGTDYKGTNYGWPKYEGVCKPGDMESCNPRDDDPNLTMPFHWYEHISYDDGGCIGGQVHVPEGIWPSEFKYLFIDFILLKIYNLELDRPDKACWECDPPLPPTRNTTFYRSTRKEGDNINEARMVEMWFGPYKDTQALYVTKFGNHDTVVRIRYTGILNKPPKPAFDFRMEGKTIVSFDASRTTDNENDDLTYKWDFGDESELNADQTRVSHEYSQPGEYVVTLEVTDSSGQEQQISKTVKIGTPPKVSILSPARNTTFSVGEILRLRGEAVDFLGNPIPDDRLTWEVRQHHANHFHPFLDLTHGNDFDLYRAPEPEDFFAATNSFLKVILIAEDEHGLTETVTVDVQPNAILVNVTTQPPGLDVIIEGYDVTTPDMVTSWNNFELPVTVSDQPPYVFQKWSDGETERERTVFIEGAPQVRAMFCTEIETQCEIHENCCSGYCSEGLCALAPITESPSMAPNAQTFLRPILVEPPPKDLEIEVFSPPIEDENDRPHPDLGEKIPIYDVPTTSDSIIDEQLVDKDDERQTSILIISLSAALVVLVMTWCGLRFTKCNKGKMDPVEDSLPSMYKDDEGSGSYTGNEDTSDDDGGIKEIGTESTEESDAKGNSIDKEPYFPQNTTPDTNADIEDFGDSWSGALEESEIKYHHAVNASPAKSDISLSFLILECLDSGEDSSSSDAVGDIENQANILGVESPSSPAKSLFAVPLSPTSSIKNDDCSIEQVAQAVGIVERSEGDQDGSFVLNDDNQNSKSETSLSFLLQLPEESQEVIVDNDLDRALNLLLVDSSIIEEEFLNASPDTEIDPLAETDSEQAEMSRLTVSDDGDDEIIEITNSNNTSQHNSLALTEDSDLYSVGSVKEGSVVSTSIMSQASSTTSNLDCPEVLSKLHDFAITTEGDSEAALSPLKSPTFRAEDGVTAGSNFMSPEANQQKPAATETPETMLLSYEDADSSIENSVSFVNANYQQDLPSKSSGLILQTSFATPM